MAEADDLLIAALRTLDPKPADTASRSQKKRYSEQMSKKVAESVAEALRLRGMTTARPAPPGLLDRSGAERRMAGGIGNKKVDVTWATEEAGLLLASSIKSINFRDRVAKNFQKNFTNRRGDMLFEAVTLHRRFPYAVLLGLFLFDWEAETDDTPHRRSTFLNAHDGLRLFTGRQSPPGRDEQFERFYVGLVNATPFDATVRWTLAGDPVHEVRLSSVLDTMVDLLSERNADSYEALGGRLRSK